VEQLSSFARDAVKMRELFGPEDPAFGPCMGLYESSFPPDEREPIHRLSSWFPRAFASKDKVSHHHFVAERGSKPVGYVYCQYLRKSRMGFIVYIVVDSSERRQGIGHQLLAHSIAILKKDSFLLSASYRGTVLEVEREQDAHGEEELRIRRARLEFFRKAGAELLTSSYVQPALTEEKSPVNLNLLVIPAEFDQEPKAAIESFYEDVFGLPPIHPFVKNSTAGLRP
jgi:ribosomal protein S18 acetylase RimI-like enzyme